MFRKKSIAIILFIVIALALGLAGCDSIPAPKTDVVAESVYYYAVKDGEVDLSDWICCRSDRWQDSEQEYGFVSNENGMLAFSDKDGNLLFEGLQDGNIISRTKNGATTFYYKNGMIGEKNTESTISILTVYEKAQSLGYDGTLEELIEAFKGDSAYAIAKKNGYTGTETEWLQSLVGAAGKDGKTPTIEIKNDYWYIDGVATGVKAVGDKGETGNGIRSLGKTSTEGLVDTYTVTFTDGTTTMFTVTNGAQGTQGEAGAPGDKGADGKGIVNIELAYSDPATGEDTYVITMSDESTYTYKVKNGKDAQYDLTVGELYDFAKENGYEGNYLDFIGYFSPKPEKDLTYINDALRATVTLVTSDAETNGGAGGSGFFYSVDTETGDAIVITDYHVVYAANANKYCSDIKVYLYGSEIAENNTTAAKEMGIPATCLGGSIYYDVAVLKITGSEIIKNSIAKAVTFGDSDKMKVGEGIIVLGNAQGYGISVTEGIVSVVSENITVESTEGGSYVSRRVFRSDAAINFGNSGGGTFGTDGKLLGMVAAKTTVNSSESMGYCIPVNVIKAVYNNVMRQYDEEPDKAHLFYKPLVGVTIFPLSSYAKLDENGNPYIAGDICVKSVAEGGLCDGKIFEGDILRTVQVNDGEKKTIHQMYHVTDTVMGSCIGDVITFEVEREVEGEPTIVTVSVTINEAAITRE